ncbi:MAG: hypothetical protein K2X66_16435 [Cyanobacteria bacterium]|nr:hypothetical protein [Cyanobacteriota bacterium]
MLLKTQFSSPYKTLTPLFSAQGPWSAFNCPSNEGPANRGKKTLRHSLASKRPLMGPSNTPAPLVGINPLGRLPGKTDEFFSQIPPEQVIQRSMKHTLDLLKDRIGETLLGKVLAGETVKSPVAEQVNGHWLKHSKIVGFHPRALGTYGNMIKYALTCPENAFHLMPLFEPGCDNSLYAPRSWHLNPEFLDPELSSLGFKTPEDQLKLVVNVMHALGKSVGMDVVPHMDRFAETVFAQPECFEWIRLNPAKTQVAESQDDLYLKVQEEIQMFLRLNDSPALSEREIQILFSPTTSEARRLERLFGPKEDPEAREKRRLELMGYLRNLGYETLPVGIYRPYRPVHFVKMEKNAQGESWPVFHIENHGPSQIFGSLTPFKWYHTQPDGTPNTDSPNLAARKYFLDHVYAFQKQFQFDFMRADMAHIQHCPDGSPARVSQKNRDRGFEGLSIWAQLKETIQRETPYFASLAEAFLKDPRCAFGDQFQNVASDEFDVALGNLHYKPVNEDYIHYVRDFNLSNYHRGHDFKVAQTVMTSDNDTFIHLFAKSLDKKVRTFLAYFLNQPSYVAMGLETRNDGVTLQDANQLTRGYTEGLILKQRGPFQWGKNLEFFKYFTQLRLAFLKHRETIQNASHFWLNPEAGTPPQVAAWVYHQPVPANPFASNLKLLCVVNTDTLHPQEEAKFENPLLALSPSTSHITLTPEYSTEGTDQIRQLSKIGQYRGKSIVIKNLAPGEGRIYKIVASPTYRLNN